MVADIEIICVGNELLIGKVLNTNASWLSKRVSFLGAKVKRVTIIQDVVEEIAAALNEVVARGPRFIITTGGLGPTFDDKTLQGIAKALDCRLEINPLALEMVRQKCIEYAKRRQVPTDTELTPHRLKMAKFPEKTQPITNPIGTAPGLRADINGTILFALPGVPSEMEAIFDESIVPLIKEAVGKEVFCQRSLFIEGIVESRLAPLIDEVMSNNEEVYIKSHPMFSETKPRIELHLTIRSNEERNPYNRLLIAVKEISPLIERNAGKLLAES